MSRGPSTTIGLFVVFLGTLAAPLDTAVNIAFPSVTRAFDLEVRDIRWIVVSYVLTYSSLMLVCGKLGDLYGYRLIFRAGLIISAGGFMACSLAPTYPLLLMGRVVQGVGIALTLSCAPALATTIFAETERTRILGMYAAMTAVGTALGPLAGGFLVERFGWSSVFWARAPIVLAALALSPLIPAQTPQASTRKFDLTGAFLLVSALVGLLLSFAIGTDLLWPTLPLILAAAGACALIAFVLHQGKASEPILRPSHFRNPGFTAINLASIVVNFAAFSVLLIGPYFLTRVARLDATTGGMVLAIGFCGTIAGAWTAGRIGPRLGTRRVTTIGVILSLAGLSLVSLWPSNATVAMMSATLALQGLGVGLFQVAYTDLVTATLPIAERGVAGSLTMVTRTIGTVTAATGLSALFRYFEIASAGQPDAFLTAFRATFTCAAASLVLGLLLVLMPHRPSTAAKRSAIRP